jgi:hypothetical protein
MRFVAASCISSQRWIPPIVLFAVALAVLFASGGSLLLNAGVGAAALFPIAAWVTIATLDDEDPSQQDVTSAAFGSPGSVRGVKLAVAAGVCLALAAASICAAALRADSATGEALAAAVLAHLLAVAGGVPLGAACARPLMARSGSALLVVAAAALADLVLPDAPPAHLVLSATGDGRGPRWPDLALAAVGTALLAAVLLGLAARVARSRS